MDHTSLSKLNVAKLKEKCKELKITGYSKLSKPLLIERLLGVASSAGANGASSSPADEVQVSQSNAPPGPQIIGASTSTTTSGPPSGSERIPTILESSQRQVESNLATKPTTKKRAGKNKEDKEPAKKKAKTKKAAVVDTSDPPQVSNDNSIVRDNPTQSKGANSRANIQDDTPDTSKGCSVAPHLPATSDIGRANSNSANRATLTSVQPTHAQTKAVGLTRPTLATVSRKAGLSRSKPSQNSISGAIHQRVPSPHPTRQAQDKEPALPAQLKAPSAP
ncbi:hypothetical protein FRC11_003353, partial [Ceratobasidium sp. 423]